MKKPQVRARQFIDADTVYTTHGTGAAYTNKNLTSAIVESILKNDPDAERLFEPLEAEEADDQDDDEKPLTKQTKAELVATYTAELGSAPDEAALKTNALLVEAIEAHRAGQ